MTELVLGVLDQSPIPEGSVGPAALANTIDLARHAEALGYHRYWVAEHHATPALAGPSPEVLMGPVAAATTVLRVGSGGVMLPHYSPLKVAECFSMLSGLFPGRIDLGIGRAPAPTRDDVRAPARPAPGAPTRLPRAARRAPGLPEDDFPDKHPFARLAALPGRPERPEVWLLGSSSQSAIWAAELGIPYAFADFINPFGADYANLYRAPFEPGRTDPARESSPRCPRSARRRRRRRSTWPRAGAQRSR